MQGLSRTKNLAKYCFRGKGISWSQEYQSYKSKKGKILEDNFILCISFAGEDERWPGGNCWSKGG